MGNIHFQRLENQAHAPAHKNESSFYDFFGLYWKLLNFKLTYIKNLPLDKFAIHFASSHLNKRVCLCLSVGPLVHRSVGPSCFRKNPLLEMLMTHRVGPRDWFFDSPLSPEHSSKGPQHWYFGFVSGSYLRRGGK